jgi:hypothetical protein
MRSVETDDLTALLRELPAVSPLASLDRLRGGSKKGVYRLRLADGTTLILYSWADDENYWPAGGAPGDPLSDASGFAEFTVAHARLAALGVGVPALLLADDSHTRFPADVAIVEDFPGTLEALLSTDPAAGGAATDRLAADLRRLHAAYAPHPGKLAGAPVTDRSCEQIIRDRAAHHLAEAAAREPRVAAVRDHLAELLARRFAVIAPRHAYSLIHGELGPDHVVVGADGRTALIDIEGLVYFDAEWEHVFLRLRFGDDVYRRLHVDGLDPARLDFYRLAMHLSLVAGPLRLLDGDYPDREFMTWIARGNTDEVLKLLAADGDGAPSRP